MKTKLFILFLFITQFVEAQTSTITVFSLEGERFYVIVNGTRQNDMPFTNVKITDLDKANYMVKIIFEDQSINSLNENVYLLDYDEKRANLTYILKRDRKKRMKMSLNDFDYDINKTKGLEVVKYHDLENPMVNTTTIPTTKTSVSSNLPTTKTTKVEHTNVDVNMLGVGINTSVEESEESVNLNINIGGLNTAVNAGTTTKTTTTTTTTTTSTSVNSTKQPTIKKEFETVKSNQIQNNFDSVKPKNSCQTAMATSDFQKAKTSIEKQSFADSKLKVAKQITTANCLSTTQITEVMQLFSFEENKLDYAKFAYGRCIDKDNYYLINDAFSFSSSSDELIEYIEKINNN